MDCDPAILGKQNHCLRLESICCGNIGCNTELILSLCIGLCIDRDCKRLYLFLRSGILKFPFQRLVISACMLNPWLRYDFRASPWLKPDLESLLLIWSKILLDLERSPFLLTCDSDLWFTFFSKWWNSVFS